MKEINNSSHKRYNPMTGEWVLVSPHRSKRPWQGQNEESSKDERLQYDEKCYLCPTNTRADGSNNPNYNGTYVFDNDFAALKMSEANNEYSDGELFVAKQEKGICRVICFSPRHDLTIAEMSSEDIVGVVRTWQDQFKELSLKEEISYVQIFENKGSVMGCSNPHPHGQIWAQSTVPVEPLKESLKFKEYYNKYHKTLLEVYLKQELEKQERILIENEHFVALIPFWATWPFESMIISKRAIQNILEFKEEEVESFAIIYKELTVMYDNLFECSFPYSAGLHQAPTDGLDYPEWHLHMHFFPPLLRSAKVKKFMVGYEMLANAQRDITPEWSAQRLRELSKQHYKSI